MATHDALAAFADSSNIDKGAVRSLTVERYIYVLLTANESQSLTVDSGSTEIKALYYNGWLFARDDTDATTAHDGTTCLVSADGVRFLKEDVPFPFSVLDILNATPGSPTAGDAYIVDTSPTGQWATDSAAEKIAVYTARGWVYIAPAIGMRVLVEDVERIYRYTVAGNWEAGIDDGSGLAADSVYPNQLRYPTGIPSVENQTTTADPAGSPFPAAGTAYIIGSGATGDWSGKDDYLAVSNGAAWEYHAPYVGMTVYDKALDNYYKYESSAWSQMIPAGLVVAEKTDEVAHGDGWNAVSTAVTSGTNYSSPPASNAGTRIKRFTHALASASNYLELSACVNVDSCSGMALFVDSEVSPRFFVVDGTLGANQGTFNMTCTVAIGDTSSHDYDLRIFASGGSPQYRGSSYRLKEITS